MVTLGDEVKDRVSGFRELRLLATHTFRGAIEFVSSRP